MPERPHPALLLGLLCVAFALLLAFVWVPMDTDSGLIEKIRRRVSIGDALAPTVAAAFIGLGGLLVLIGGRGPDQAATLTGANLRFLAWFLALLIGSFLVMRHAGPALGWLTGQETEYRLLRDTAPWKWVGFATGGFVLVFGLISIVEGRISLRAGLVGVAAVLVLIAVFDLPFDDLLLPPNGDL